MQYYALSPEVAGGLGSNTDINTGVHPPIVSRLHYEFYGWLGDELLESFPCYSVTENLAHKLQNARLTGFSLDKLEVSASDEFAELYPELELPPFLWLKIEGRAGQDDFGMSQDHRLVVSESALAVLQSGTLANCEVANYP